MTASEKQLRDYHYKNYDAVRKALTHVERAVKAAIRKGDKAATDSLTRTQMMLVAVKAEARLFKLLYLPDGFTEPQRGVVFLESTVYDMWVRAVEIGFRAKFGIAQKRDVQSSLLHDDAARWDTIHNVLREDLQPIITVRNKLAHGQWVRPLNSTRDGVETWATKFVTTENALTLIHRDNALEGIANIVGDLIQQGRRFQANFNQHYVKIKSAHDHLAMDGFSHWVAGLRRGHLIGQEKMRQNLNLAQERSRAKPEGDPAT